MIKAYYNPDHVLHNPQYELYDGLETEYSEKPDRIRAIIGGLEQANVSLHSVKVDVPHKLLCKIHDERYVAFLKNKSANVNDRKQIIPSYYIEDTYTPLTRHTYNVALHSAGLALHGAKKLLSNPKDVIYALCRPPGHHAEKKAMGGYCYFNNSAIAAQFLSEHGRVAILDVDYHHGNGTQESFYNRDDVLYVSMHADPETAFPYLTGFAQEIGTGVGEGFNINLPLEPGTDNKEYLAVLDKAIDHIAKFKPDFIVLSMGFDTYEEDPIGGMGLNEEVYGEIGFRVASINRPLLIVQEGGYNIDKLGELTVNFIDGINRASETSTA